MAGRSSAEETAVYVQAVDKLRGRGADGIIRDYIGMSRLLGEAAEAAGIINIRIALPRRRKRESIAGQLQKSDQRGSR
jgi:hypothetical protein